MEQARRKKFYANVSVSAIQRIVNLFTSFINRTIFIYTLGVAYLGVGGLFTDMYMRKLTNSTINDIKNI